jgi:hypothetical protein
LALIYIAQKSDAQQTNVENAVQILDAAQGEIRRYSGLRAASNHEARDAIDYFAMEVPDKLEEASGMIEELQVTTRLLTWIILPITIVGAILAVAVALKLCANGTLQGILAVPNIELTRYFLVSILGLIATGIESILLFSFFRKYSRLKGLHEEVKIARNEIRKIGKFINLDGDALNRLIRLRSERSISTSFEDIKMDLEDWGIHIEDGKLIRAILIFYYPTPELQKKTLGGLFQDLDNIDDLSDNELVQLAERIRASKTRVGS